MCCIIFIIIQFFIAILGVILVKLIYTDDYSDDGSIKYPMWLYLVMLVVALIPIAGLIGHFVLFVLTVFNLIDTLDTITDGSCEINEDGLLYRLFSTKF